LSEPSFIREPLDVATFPPLTVDAAFAAFGAFATAAFAAGFFAADFGAAVAFALDFALALLFFAVVFFSAMILSQ
jgi:hypothetical protein